METCHPLQLLLCYVCVLTIATATLMTCNIKRNTELDNKTSDLWLLNEILLRDSPSRLACASLCMKEKACVTFMENRNSKVCRLHATRITRKNELTNAAGFVAYDTCRGNDAVGNLCTSSTNCNLTNTGCNRGICTCVQGWSYSPGHLGCVRECQKYGRFFTRTENHRMNTQGQGILTDSKFLTVKKCAKACLETTQFTCRSFNLNSTVCELQAVTSLNSKLIFSDGNYYQRDCLYV